MIKKDFKDKSNQAVGIFDSGLGGISVVKTISEVMPNESLIYYGDSAFAPYGIKSIDQVTDRVFSIVDELVYKGIKALVIACNTATSITVDLLRKKYDMPILGLEPALKPAIDEGKKNIIVLATEITIREKKFAALLKRFEDRANIYKKPVSKLVDVVENDNINQETVSHALDDILVDLDSKKVDGLILGCTHFIFAKKELHRIFPNAKIYDGNLGVSEHLKSILEHKKLLNLNTKRETIFLSSDNNMLERFKKYAR